LERSNSGDFGYETGGALDPGGGQRNEDLPGSRALGFVTTGYPSPFSVSPNQLTMPTADVEDVHTWSER
jgi:hypothetical protein